MSAPGLSHQQPNPGARTIGRDPTVAGDASRSGDPAARALGAFRREFGPSPDLRVAVAPGRVNLVGGHTDYNDGFVLPAALDRRVAVAFASAPADDAAIGEETITVRAADASETGAVRPADLSPGAHHGWLAYVAGTAWALREAGLELPPLRMAVAGDVPVGAGLASSAALEMAVARAVWAASPEGRPWEPRAAAKAGRRAENDYVGVATGIMDQLVAATARPGHALFLDCRSLEHRHVPVPAGAEVLVLDTGVRRELVESAYGERRAACRRAVEAIRGAGPPGRSQDRAPSRSPIRALRDVEPEHLEELAGHLDREALDRARHVIAENARTRRAARALDVGDLEETGRLMAASHQSLRDLYRVSSPELDLVVEAAASHPGCYGARLTGAGFGGCAVALVQGDRADAVAAAVAEAYRSGFDRPLRSFSCRPGGGARLLDE